MNTNKLFTEFSLKKIWDKLKQHDKTMNSTILVLSSDNWTQNENGTFTNTIQYSSFKETDKLTVDLYDDGNLTETLLIEYCMYIQEFEIINGALVATANMKPTQSMTLVVKGEFEVNEVQVSTVRCVNDFTSTETNTPASANLARLLKEDLEDVKSNINNQNKKFDNFKCGSESLVTNSTGIYTVTFDKPMLSENYVLNITQAIGSSELITGASVILTEKTINGFTFRLTRTSAIASNLPFAIEWLAISL